MSRAQSPKAKTITPAVAGPGHHRAHAAKTTAAAAAAIPPVT